MLFDGKFRPGPAARRGLRHHGAPGIEKVSLYSCHHHGKEPVLLPPCTGGPACAACFKFLEGLEGGGDFPFDKAVEAVLRRHRGRGVAVLLSDFLTFGDLERPLNLLFSAGLEVFAIQILSPVEMNPKLTGTCASSTAKRRRRSTFLRREELLGLYHEHRLQMEAMLAAMCRQRSGKFLAVSSQEPLEGILFRPAATARLGEVR